MPGHLIKVYSHLRKTHRQHTRTFKHLLKSLGPGLSGSLAEGVSEKVLDNS